ncbi:hypothetical protein [Lacticaseibacillus camelliae]|uniref:Uncharacterized protein n=1 Tax=Lacticaseibacillus camelliae DSM 22697 = JCM 13995 TaxID=1423730 RepID=A0A0R2FKM7_9LACO|nr:hypothetical protein [Lacticaseibacillus camelliae]KRN25338.1 hypothetical protein FC75_GL000700 [Lacticaseibacillus camelliae DSM 22697 = JCM 13995]
MKTPWFDGVIITIAVLALIALVTIGAILPAIAVLVLMGVAVAVDRQQPHGRLRF